MKFFQIYYEAFKGTLHSEHEVVVLVLHFMLVNEDFVCVGTGDKFTAADDTAGNEVLPSGWNKNGKAYALKYRSRIDKLKVIVKCSLVGDMFLVSVVPMNSSETVLSVKVKPDKYVTPNWRGSYTEAFVSGDVQPLADLLKQEVLIKLRGPKASEKSKEQEQPKKNDAQRNPNGKVAPSGGISDYGRSDLDPLNRGGGGGMLFDPFRPNPSASNDPSGGILPPGTVPPGARFDPITPKFPPKEGVKGKDKGKELHPPDHFPPPDGKDDPGDGRYM